MNMHSMRNIFQCLAFDIIRLHVLPFNALRQTENHKHCKSSQTWMRLTLIAKEASNADIMIVQRGYTENLKDGSVAECYTSI